MTARTPASRKRGAPAHALVGVDELAARRVREDPVALAAEEPPDRLVPRAPEEIPDGHLDDPVAPVVEVDRLDDLVHGLRVGDGSRPTRSRSSSSRSGSASPLA